MRWNSRRQRALSSEHGGASDRGAGILRRSERVSRAGIWAASGAGYFWPIWVILGWGIGIVFHAWTVFGQKPITEDDVQREMQRGRNAEPPVA